jgi:large subunit ribosomal protein L31
MEGFRLLENRAVCDNRRLREKCGWAASPGLLDFPGQRARPLARWWLSHRPRIDSNSAKGKTMAKEGIHPNYREILFVDMSNGFKFVTRSCANTKEMGKTDDGRELPLFKLDTTSESHPFYTGTQKSVDNMGGRVEKFRNRFGKTTGAASK